MRDPGQALARDQPAASVPGHLQPERAGPAGVHRDRQAVTRLHAAERAARQCRGARTLRSGRLPGVQQPEEDRRRTGVTVTRAAERAGRGLAEHIRVMAGRGQAVGQPVVVLLSQPGRDHQVEHDDAHDVDHGDNPCRGSGHPRR
jgi:hypothetical protein